MSSRIVSNKQRQLFKALEHEGTLIFAAGPKGISANIVGEFQVRSLDSEDRLCMGDGTNHIHIDWSRIKAAEIGDFHGEGMLTFYDGDEVLFRLYKPAGPYRKELQDSSGALL
ncbi:MAG: hypothetical protein P1V97_17975 [Planctomycetota bacterium]|nr:hypothetical protein [Planctomycetota bacterium]